MAVQILIPWPPELHAMDTHCAHNNGSAAIVSHSESSTFSTLVHVSNLTQTRVVGPEWAGRLGKADLCLQDSKWPFVASVCNNIAICRIGAPGMAVCRIGVY